MKLKFLLIVSICLVNSVYSTAEQSEKNITLVNTSDNTIKVFFAHPQFCGTYTELDYLHATLNQLEFEFAQQHQPAFSMIPRYSDSYLFQKIVAYQNMIKRINQKRNEAKSIGKLIEPDYVCKVFTVSPRQTLQEKDFVSTSLFSRGHWFAQSYEIHVWDESTNEMKSLRYVKPGSILSYPCDFIQN